METQFDETCMIYLCRFDATETVTNSAFSMIWPRVAAAQGGSPVWPDSNGNRIIEISELFDAIDYYFSGEPIPAPEPLPVARTSVSKWVQSPITSAHHGLGLLNSAEEGPIYGPWYLSLECHSAGEPAVFTWRIGTPIFTNELDFQEMSIETTLGNVSQSDVWLYLPPEGIRTDYFA